MLTSRQPTGNTQAIVMVVAEHAASKILALDSGNSTTTTTTGDNEYNCE